MVIRECPIWDEFGNINQGCLNSAIFMIIVTAILVGLALWVSRDLRKKEMR